MPNSLTEQYNQIKDAKLHRIKVQGSEGAKAATAVVVQKKRKANTHATEEAKKAARTEQIRQARQKRRHKQAGKQKKVDDLQKESNKLAPLNAQDVYLKAELIASTAQTVYFKAELEKSHRSVAAKSSGDGTACIYNSTVV